MEQRCTVRMLAEAALLLKGAPLLHACLLPPNCTQPPPTPCFHPTHPPTHHKTDWRVVVSAPLRLTNQLPVGGSLLVWEQQPGAGRELVGRQTVQVASGATVPIHTGGREGLPVPEQHCLWHGCLHWPVHQAVRYATSGSHVRGAARNRKC